MRRFSQVFTFGLVSSLAVLANAQPQSFYWQAYHPDTDSKLYDHCDKTCPDIDYTLINTGNIWLDTIINKAVVNGLDAGNDDNPKLKASYQKFNATPLPTSREYTQQLNQAITFLVNQNNALIKERGKDWAETNLPLIQQYARPDYLGHKMLANNTLELVKLSTYTYSGGAHGLGNDSYYVFDMSNQRQLTLDDILLPNQKANLEKALKAKFIDWIKQNNDNPSEYQKMWQFHLTDNFTFSQQGLRFIYQPYEISPYALGMPELTLKYSELAGIIKPEYL